MSGLRILISFVFAFAGIALGIRSYVRIARAARAAGELQPGPADSMSNSASVYAYAFKHFSTDTVLMLVGFVGGLGLAAASFALAR